MSDQLLERRLRAALHDEADGLLITITPAELERRAAMRRRGLWGGRRWTLLVAAAVTTSLLVVAGGLSGVFRQAVIAPTSSPVASASPTPTPAASPAPVLLPSLDALVAVDPGSVLAAQAHGPANGDDPSLTNIVLPDPVVVLGIIQANVDYVVSLGCLGAGSEAQLDISNGDRRGAPNGPTVACDGAMHDTPLRGSLPEQVGFRVYGKASWRAILRGPSPTAGLDSPVATLEPAPAGADELVRWDASALETAAQPWGSDGLVVQEVGATGERERYTVAALCSAGPPIRLILGDQSGGPVTAATETLLRCTPTEPRSATFAVPGRGGSQLFIAAAPGQTVSLVVTSPTPPVALAEAPSGWQVEGGIGPSLTWDVQGYSFGAASTGHDRVMVVFGCTGTAPIDVEVDDSYPLAGGTHLQHLAAACSPEGSTTSHVFAIRKTGAVVGFTSPGGIWTALTILSPG